MTDHLIHRRAAMLPTVEEAENELVLRALLSPEESAADLSVTWVELAGHHRRLVTDRSTRLYLVVDGRGTITVDEEILEVERGDLVVIPPGTPYHLDGDLIYVVMNQPGFREGDDRYLEPPGV